MFFLTTSFRIRQLAFRSNSSGWQRDSIPNKFSHSLGVFANHEPNGTLCYNWRSHTDQPMMINSNLEFQLTCSHWNSQLWPIEKVEASTPYTFPGDANDHVSAHWFRSTEISTQLLKPHVLWTILLCHWFPWRLPLGAALKVELISTLTLVAAALSKRKPLLLFFLMRRFPAHIQHHVVPTPHL